MVLAERLKKEGEIKGRKEGEIKGELDAWKEILKNRASLPKSFVNKALQKEAELSLKLQQVSA